MIKNLRTIAVTVGLLIASSPALAGPDEELRDASRTEAAKLRADGWPTTRCFVGIWFEDGVVVGGNGTILPGDRLIQVNAVPVSTAESVAKAFATAAPGTTITIKLTRADQQLSVQQQCGNLAEYQQAYLAALDLAAQKKWYECIDALAGHAEDPTFLWLRVRCARVSRKAADYPIQEWVDKSVRVNIARGRYATAEWPRFAESLLKARFDLSPSVYADLVQEVKAWDNGKSWTGVQPDLALLRSAAERGLKSKLIDPQSAIVEMPFDFIWGTWTPAFSKTGFEGFMTCGSVNAKNRMGGYTGATSFISVVADKGIERFTDMDSGTSQYFRPVDNACLSLAKKLTYVGGTNAATNPTASARPSVSEELEKLAKLHASGALSAEEYAVAKSRVLKSN